MQQEKNRVEKILCRQEKKKVSGIKVKVRLVYLRKKKSGNQYGSDGIGREH